MDIKAFGVKKTYKKDKTGKFILNAKGKKIVAGEEYFINPRSEYVKPYTMVPRNKDLNPTHPELITILPNSWSADVPLEMVDEGFFEGAYMTAQIQPTEQEFPLLFELIDVQRRVSLTGRPCHINTVVGNGERPFVLPESIVADKRQSFLVRFFNMDANITYYVRFQLHGQRIYSEQVRDRKLDTYVKNRQKRNRNVSVYMCPLDVDPSVPANTSGEFYFTNDHNIYFEVRKITLFSENTVDPVGVKFQIIDEKNNGMSSGWVELLGAVGSAQYPFIFYGPWMVMPGGKLTIQIQNTSGADAKLYITLSGRQHFIHPGP